MTTTQPTIRRASLLGLRIQIRWPDRLGWKAPRKPPDEFLVELRQHKAEIIIAFSRVRPAKTWTAAETIEVGLLCDYITGRLPASTPTANDEAKAWDAPECRAPFDGRTGDPRI
jgi:hypothetical protein